MWIDTGGDSETCTFVILSSLTQCFLWVSFGQSFWFSWLWICIWYILGSSNMCVHISQPSWILVKRPMGRLISFHFWPPRVLVVRKVFLTLGMGNMWSFISYGKAQPLLLFYNLHLGVWVHREQTPAVHPGARLSPVSGLPILCGMRMARVASSFCFWPERRSFQLFRMKNDFSDWFVICGLLCGAVCFLSTTLLKVLNHKWMLNFVNCVLYFCASIDMIIWFLSFLLFMWCITLICRIWTILASLEYIPLVVVYDKKEYFL